MRVYNIRRTKFCNLSDEELDATICEIKAEHPHVGEVMLNGHLRARNIVVQRRRLRGLMVLVLSPGEQQLYKDEYTLCLVQTIYGT